MRLFTIIKTGYTSGVYGNSGEYFTLIMINNKNTSSIKFDGMYGAEYRVEEYLKNKGYKSFYTSANYGKLKRDDILKQTTYSEYELLKGGKLDEQIKVLRNTRKEAVR
jgi:hypothetical protein